MTEQSNTVGNPWEQVGMGFAKQQGPDGLWYVGIHLGTPAMSAVVLLPADGVEKYFDAMRGEVAKLAMECRLSNKGIVTSSGVAKRG